MAFKSEKRNPRRQIELDIISLENYIRDCNFEKTADTYAFTLIGIKKALERKYIDVHEYHQYKDRSEKLLKENKCKCTSAGHTDEVIRKLLHK